jgi:predicted transcriptional regulator
VTLNKIIELLHCKILCGENNLGINIKSANASDLMSDVLALGEPHELLLTGLTNHHVIKTCHIAGICAVVFVKNKKPDTETVQYADKCNIPALSTDLSMFEACGILYANGIKATQTEK